MTKIKDLIIGLQCWEKAFGVDLEVVLAAADGEEYLLGAEYVDGGRPTKLWIDIYADETSPTRGMVMGFDGALVSAK